MSCLSVSQFALRRLPKNRTHLPRTALGLAASYALFVKDALRANPLADTGSSKYSVVSDAMGKEPKFVTSRTAGYELFDTSDCWAENSRKQMTCSSL